MADLAGLTARRRLPVAAFIAWMLLAASGTISAQSQIQYTYDAAGNVIQITRSSSGPQPDLTITNLSVGTPALISNGQYNIPVNFTVKNVGNATAKATWYDYGYLSTNGILNIADTPLSGFNTQGLDLAPAASYNVVTTFSTNTGTAPGNYTLIVKTDGGAAASGQYSPTGGNRVAESDETNNTKSSTLNLPGPDLTVSNLTVGAITLNTNGSFSIPATFQVNNIGNGPAKATWYDYGYLSNDSQIDSGDQLFSSTNLRSTDLAAGASYTASITFVTNASTHAGPYYLIVKADGASYVLESNKQNNTTSLAITLPGPDLTVSNLALGSISVNQDGSYNLPVTFQVNNIGGSVAKATWYDYGYLSNTTVLHDTDQILSRGTARATNLAAGASYAVSTTLKTSTTTASGPHYLIVKADGGIGASGSNAPTGPNVVAEIDETNNTQALAVTLPEQPDLTVTNLVVGTITARSGGGFNIPVTFQVNNVGGSAAKATWYDVGYLSSDSALDDADEVLAGYNTHSLDLAAGASYSVSATFTSGTTTLPGPRAIFVKADGLGGGLGGKNTDNGKLAEANEANNTQAVSVLLPGPDLTVTNLVVGAIAENQNGSYNIPVTFQVNNIGTVTAKATWYDYGYLSTDAVLNDTDQVLGGYNTHSTDLTAGASYAVTKTFTSNTSTAPGTYTLIVKADGGSSAAGQYAPTGRNYVAEIDETNNTQTAPVTLPGKPDLAITNLSVGSPVTVAQSGAYSFSVTYTVTNNGSVSAQPSWYDVGYLSTDGALDNPDQVLSGYHTQSVALAAGASYTVNGTFTTTAATAPGAYTLFVKADGLGGSLGGANTDNGKVVETNESNNTQSVALTLPTKPDLTVSNLSLGTPITVAQSGVYSIPVTYTVSNGGVTAAQPSWYDVGYLSIDGTLDNADQLLGGYHTQSTALAAGASYTVNGTLTTTAATPPGAYTLIVKADGRGGSLGGMNIDTGKVVESSETNNTQAISVTLPIKPDLTVGGLIVGAPITVAQTGAYSFPVTFNVTNTGGTAAQPSWYDVGYLSFDGALNNSDQLLGGYHTQSVVLAAGSSYTVNGTFTTTAATTPGTYTLFVKADGRGGSLGGTNTDSGKVVEADETNNTQAVSITLPAKPDLTVSNLSVGSPIAVAQSGIYSIQVTYTVTNVGGTVAQPSWYDVGYLSADAALDNADQVLGGYHTQSVALAAGASYTVTGTFTTTAATGPGSYTLFVKADGRGGSLGGTNTDAGKLVEGSEANNAQTVALTLPIKPDLTIAIVSLGAIIKNANGSYSIPIAYMVTNNGGADAALSWYDVGYLSTDASLDNTDQVLGGYHTQSVALAAGGSYTVNGTFTTSTTTVAGAYTLFVKVDGRGGSLGGTNTDSGKVVEAAETNNTASTSVVLP